MHTVQRCTVEEASAAVVFTSSVSSVMESGGSSSSQNEIGGSPSGRNGFDVNAEKRLVDFGSAAREAGILHCFSVSAFD